MGRSTLIAKRSLLGAPVGLALLSACTSAELALGRNDPANPRAVTAPLPAMTRLSSSADVPPMAPPVPEGHRAPQHDMPAGMKMEGDEMAPVAPHAAHNAGHTEMTTADASKNQATAAPQKAAHWTCTMHPNVDLPKPGNCPICGMKLVPKAGDAVDGGAK